jgi:hypothetical protein
MIRIQIDTADVRRRLGALQADMPTVCRNALNDTAFGLKAHLTELLKKTFPTANPATVKNLFVMKATKDHLYSTVLFEQLYQQGWGLNEYMMPLIEGGGRAMKPSEKRMGRYWIPAYKTNPGMLNKYGNVPGGKVQQILSRMGLFNEGGYSSNALPANQRRKKWYGAKKETEYLMLPHGSGHLKAGVYQRYIKPGLGLPRAVRQTLGDGAFQRGKKKLTSPIRNVVRARGLKPILLFVKQPRYHAMFPFFTSGQQYVDATLPGKINTEIGWAIKRHMKRVGL